MVRQSFLISQVWRIDCDFFVLFPIIQLWFAPLIVKFILYLLMFGLVIICSCILDSKSLSSEYQAMHMVAKVATLTWIRRGLWSAHLGADLTFVHALPVGLLFSKLHLHLENVNRSQWYMISALLCYESRVTCASAARSPSSYCMKHPIRGSGTISTPQDSGHVITYGWAPWKVSDQFDGPWDFLFTHVCTLWQLAKVCSHYRAGLSTPQCAMVKDLKDLCSRLSRPTKQLSVAAL